MGGALGDLGSSSDLRTHLGQHPTLPGPQSLLLFSERPGLDDFLFHPGKLGKQRWDGLQVLLLRKMSGGTPYHCPTQFLD